MRSSMIFNASKMYGSFSVSEMLSHKDPRISVRSVLEELKNRDDFRVEAEYVPPRRPDIRLSSPSIE